MKNQVSIILLGNGRIKFEAKAKGKMKLVQLNLSL